MFFNRNHIILLVVTVLLVFSGCSGYEKLLKSSDYRLKFTKAMEYYEAEEYVRAGTLFDQRCRPVYTSVAWTRFSAMTNIRPRSTRGIGLR